MSKPCAHCESLEHTSFYCYKKPRTSLARPTKPIKQKGRVGKATDKAVAEWSKQQQPNHQGYYVCHYCLAWITYLRAEHGESKARSPERRADKTNLYITCDPCNEKKRSKSHDEFCTRCD